MNENTIQNTSIRSGKWQRAALNPAALRFSIITLASLKESGSPRFVKQGKTEDENCLVIINQDGECVVLTKEFERALMEVSKRWFE